MDTVCLSWSVIGAETQEASLVLHKEDLISEQHTCENIYIFD